ncbi:DUF2948 family protein [Paracoccus jiaweipingae]|uniref:DUF2948 family protein n=1 Tax=unclassified Paracoccus (in: a-proteobacteria) TaxID=2688777 RepID=UPI0037A16F4E
MTDASFRDADPDQPLALRAEDGQDLRILSALVQDAVLTVDDLSYDPRARRFAALINRFRWEDADRAQSEPRAFERVRSLLVASDVTGVRSDGIDRKDASLVLSLLQIGFQEQADGTGRLLLDFSGDGTIAIDVECVNVDLRDVTRPYRAPSGQMPRHGD